MEVKSLTNSRDFYPDHPNYENLKYWGVRAKISDVSQTFRLRLSCSKHLKEVDIKFVFKVIAKFGDYKHNKDIKKNCGKKTFFPLKGGGWGRCKIRLENSITFTFVFIETFP